VRFGKASFEPAKLLENLKALQETIDRNKPSGAKGRYWRSLYVTSTMGPSVAVDVTALQDIKQES
jgi:large subunit ribosomal protein L1